MAVSQTGHQVLDLLVLLYSMAWLSRGRGAGRHSEASRVSIFWHYILITGKIPRGAVVPLRESKHLLLKTSRGQEISKQHLKQETNLCNMIKEGHWWEGGLGENRYMYIYDWVPLLFTWNYHNIVYSAIPQYKIKSLKFGKREKIKEGCCCLVPKSCPTFGTLAHQALLSMGSSRRECWSGLPFSRRSSWPKNRIWVSCLAGGWLRM